MRAQKVVLEHFSLGWFKSLSNFFLVNRKVWGYMGLCIGCRRKLLNPIYKGHKVEVIQSPGPEDFIWENVETMVSRNVALRRF
jgi:hypothetical protein